MKDITVGFIGQGYIGRNYADDFEDRGYKVVRYSLEAPHKKNGSVISDCDIVFIAVPTPTTPKGFDAGILRSVMSLIGEGKIAVIKSTILPGTTEEIQTENPHLFVFHSPEFLTEVTAREDAGRPERNIIGIPRDTGEFRKKAELVMSILPRAPYELITSSKHAEFLKYANNTWFFVKVVHVNLLHDLAEKLGLSWDVIRPAFAADSRVGSSHLNPIHKDGRGAGGNCFIKDFEAFYQFFTKNVDDPHSQAVFESIKQKNIGLLKKTNKDIHLLKQVYGELI